MKMEWLKIDLEVVLIVVDWIGCVAVGCDSLWMFPFSWIISSRYLKKRILKIDSPENKQFCESWRSFHIIDEWLFHIKMDGHLIIRSQESLVLRPSIFVMCLGLSDFKL